MLSCDDHLHLHGKIGRDPAESRPDITHQLLMTLLDSPLNKAGKLKVYIRTAKRVLIDINPKLRVPRTYKRFAGLMGELQHSVPILYPHKVWERSILYILYSDNELFFLTSKLNDPCRSPAAVQAPHSRRSGRRDADEGHQEPHRGAPAPWYSHLGHTHEGGAHRSPGPGAKDAGGQARVLRHRCHGAWIHRGNRVREAILLQQVRAHRQCRVLKASLRLRAAPGHSVIGLHAVLDAALKQAAVQPRANHSALFVESLAYQ